MAPLLFAPSGSLLLLIWAVFHLMPLGYLVVHHLFARRGLVDALLLA